jgi:hypothetical protein
MSTGFKIHKQGDLHHLVGAIDEQSDFSTLLAAPRPLKLGLARIQTINSIGIHGYIKFVSAFKDDEIELHECSRPVMDLINTIPATLGRPSRPSRVKSIYTPYRCRSCDKEFGLLIAAPDFAACFEGFPRKVCTNCGAQLACTADPDDLFFFLECNEE